MKLHRRRCSRVLWTKYDPFDVVKNCRRGNELQDLKDHGTGQSPVPGLVCCMLYPLRSLRDLPPPEALSKMMRPTRDLRPISEPSVLFVELVSVQHAVVCAARYVAEVIAVSDDCDTSELKMRRLAKAMNHSLVFRNVISCGVRCEGNDSPLVGQFDDDRPCTKDRVAERCLYKT